MWIIDIRHWLNEEGTEPGAPQLKNKIKKLTEIILYVTSTKAGIKSPPVPECWRRPKRKPCVGKLDMSLDPEEKVIRFYCPKCKDEGVITGWQGLIWDLSDGVDCSW